MNDTKMAGPMKVKTLRLVRETLRELDTNGPTAVAEAGRRSHAFTCNTYGCSWADSP